MKPEAGHRRKPDMTLLPDRKRLLAWYDTHRRDLPWRAKPGMSPDPYHVWLSEVMLQQTTVSAVRPYFETFTRIWPNVEALAKAPIEAVMAAWAGLGYYSRARNLHAAAKAVLGEFGGVLPRNEADLRRLPGIGVYTAAAIAAIAFEEPALPVDGNVERVISRLFAIEEPLPGAKAAIGRQAAGLVGTARHGDLAQAMMDLGATICTPRKPNCPACPLGRSCLGRRKGIAGQLPRRSAKAERPKRYGAAFVLIDRGGAVLLRQRPPGGLLGGMAEVPGSAWGTDRRLLEEPDFTLPIPAEPARAPHSVTHLFTHFSLELAVFVARLPGNPTAPAGLRWVKPDELGRQALPSVMKKVLAAAGVAPLARDARGS
jgi:A/G-specific adenine glycosylase